MAHEGGSLVREPPFPPSPPPRPPPSALQSDTSVTTSTRASPLIRKLQAAADGCWLESGEIVVGDNTTPTGWYFFYGTLIQPSFLAEVLKLDELPMLRPARITGYSLRLWGQYPALIEGERGQEVRGMAWKVEEKKHAERLGEYETRAYRPAPCVIYFTDIDDEDANECGYSFKYCGNKMDLSDGKFDLEDWLKSIGRTNL